VELWYKLHRVSGEPLFDKREFGGRGNYGATLSSQHGIQVFYDDPTVGGVEISAVPPPLPATNVFHHFAATFRQLNSNFVEVVTFVDGVVVRTTVMQGSLARTVNNVPFFIGAEGGPGAVMAGIIDEVSLYNRVLSVAEIRNVFDAGAGGKCQGPVGTSNCAPPAGLTGWWPLDDNVLDIAGTNVGRFTGNPVFTNGQVGRALFFDGTDDGVRFSASPSLNVGTSQGFSLEAWVFVPDLRLNPVFEWNDESVNVGPHLWVSQNNPGTLFANLVDTANTSHQILSAPNLVAAGVWQHVGLTYSKSNGLAKLFVNGVVVQQQNMGIFTPRTGLDLWLGRRASIPFQHSLVGAIDLWPGTGRI